VVGVHPSLELHIMDDGKVTTTFTGAADEFLGEDELVVGVKQLGNWPDRRSNSLKGREPRSEESRKLGIVSKLVYSETTDFQKLHRLIMKREYVDDFIGCARKPAQSTKGSGQARVEAKGAGKSKAHEIVSKEQAKQGKERAKFVYEEIQKGNPTKNVFGKRSRKPTEKVLNFDSEWKSNATPKLKSNKK